MNVTTTWTPTENQVNYVTKLVNEKIAESERANWFHHLRQVSSNSGLDKAIKTLQVMPYLASARRALEVPGNLPNLPDAHYALGADEHWVFYHVSRPTEGKWVGRTFLDLEVSDDYTPIRGFKQVESILAKIAEDPQAAAENYGKQIGKCFKCHRTLTNDASRARGIGPICANLVGW